MANILFVRGTSSLPDEELEQRLLERKPQFLEVPGLVQKIYSRDSQGGAISGIYFFESASALEEFTQSELAQSIATAYEVDDIRIEKYEILYPLRDGIGPV